MTTKEQERKALEKIRKIVAELGADSYLGMAFDGCFELAEENIEYDFGNSPKEMLETARANAVKYQEEAQAEQRRAEAINEAHRAQVEALEAEISRLKGQLTEEKQYGQQKKDGEAEAVNTAMEYWNGWQATKAKLEEAEQNIIGLKAKLYDLMTA